jgi:hypothetical protein
MNKYYDYFTAAMVYTRRKLSDMGVMNKHMVLYQSPVSGKQVMDQSTPEQMKASMDEWVRCRGYCLVNKNPAFAGFFNWTVVTS